MGALLDKIVRYDTCSTVLARASHSGGSLARKYVKLLGGGLHEEGGFPVYFLLLRGRGLHEPVRYISTIK